MAEQNSMLKKSLEIRAGIRNDVGQPNIIVPLNSIALKSI